MHSRTAAAVLTAALTAAAAAPTRLARLMLIDTLKMTACLACSGLYTMRNILIWSICSAGQLRGGS
jgi:hypothetical protein